MHRLEALEDRALLSGASPTAVADVYTTAEDAALTVTPALGVLSNDTDPESDVLTAVQDTGPANGTLTLNTDGSFSYTPNADFNGIDSFTYHANDGTSDSNVVTVTLNVTAVNDAPVAVNDAYATTEDTPLTVLLVGGVLANDTDVDADPLTAIVDVTTANGTLILAPDGSFVYTPNANFNGTDTFTYHANDGTADSNIATVTITVSAVNDAPVAVDDAYTTAEDTLLTVPLVTGVLANDTDVEGDPLTAVLDTTTANGTLVLAADGSFTYTPNANFNGADTFTYHANDGTADGNVATVTITVTAVNDVPVAVDDAYATAEDTLLAVLVGTGVLVNDTDADGNPLTAVLDTTTANGTLVLAADGSFVYTPNANFNGTDTFTYHANDGTADSNIATVTITVTAVNDAPVAVDDAYTTTEDTPLTVLPAGVLLNDTDADGDPLTAVLDTTTANGTLVLSADGSFTYSPNANFNGTDSFTYHANDGTADSSIATVTITVTAVNDVPVAVDDAYSTAEDTLLTVLPAGGVLVNDTDADGNPLTAVLDTTTANGTLVLAADGSFVYTPNANFNGTDTFTYHANDGTADSNIATVTITVTAVNDVPVAVDDAYTTAEDTPLSVLVATGVLVNDTDADGNPLTAVLDTTTANGTLVLAADGSFTYTPNANFNGSDTFTYHANDGTADSNIATVTITVTAVNDAPVAVADAYTTVEDTPLTVLLGTGVLANDTDVEGGPLTAILDSTTANGTLVLAANGSFTYTPNANFSGTDTFTYHANDGAANSNVATVTITVTAVNDAPVAVNDAYITAEDTPLVVAAAGVLLNDTDADGNPLTAVLNTTTTNGTLVLNANGSFTYTPNANFNGSDSFTYHANDGTADSNIATVTITVTAVNDAPVAVNDLYGTTEDTPLTIPAAGVLSNDTDTEGNPLIAVLNTTTSNGTLVLNANGSFVYTPNANFNGTDSFTYHANDGTANSNIATVTITVTGVNDAPVAVADSFATMEDTALTIPAAGVLTNDTDADGNSLTAVLDTTTSNGTLVLNADGSFTYTPNANFNGTDSFTYHANDGTADSNSVTVTITVTAVNDAPVSLNDAYSMNEDGILVIASGTGVLANDTDAEGDPLIAVLVTGTTNGTLVLNANGSFVYTPNADFNGTDTFTYRANDGTDNGNIATVTITVNAQNEAPVIVTSAGTQTVKGRKRIVVDPAINLIDADSTNFNGGQLVVSIQSGAGTKDILGFRRGGAGKGLVNARKGQIRVGKTVVGTISGGTDGTPLTIIFNAEATQDRVEIVMQSLTFRGTPKEPGQRVIAFQITDETALQSNVATKTVEVV